DSALRSLGLGDRSAARKADKLPTGSEAPVARQIIRVSQTTRSGDRELVRVRPFVRVTGNLSMSVSELSASIPPFNPQRLLADAGSGGTTAADAPGAAPDAEVSFVTRELTPLLARVKVAAVLSLDDVLASVRDVVNWTGSAGNAGRYAVAGAEPSV